MPPVVAFVGKSKSGKTTLLEKLIPELRSRGYSVATVKHASSGLTLDKAGKDSWRHIQAGSEATVVSSSDKLALIKSVTQTPNLDEIVHLFGEDYDIILAEGFKQSNATKIEVHRSKLGTPLNNVKKLIAIATDEPLETETKQFSLEDIKGLADFLENSFIQPQKVNFKMKHKTEEPKVEMLQEVVIAVENMNQAVALYEDLFGLKFDIEWTMPDENMNVKAAKLGETLLQIVESTSSKGVVASFIKNRGEGLNHIAFKVTNLQKMITKLKRKGVRLTPEKPIVTPHGTYIFVHPKSAHGVLVELIESEKQS